MGECAWPECKFSHDPEWKGAFALDEPMRRVEALRIVGVKKGHKKK